MSGLDPAQPTDDDELLAAAAERARRSDGELLADAFAAAGARGGAVGGGRPGAKGGARGGRLGARLLKTRSFEQQVTSEGRPGALAERMSEVFEQLGEMVDGEIAADGGRAELRGIIGAGLLNQNPAVVRVELRADGPQRTGVRLHAATKEGLIRQRTGEKAVKRLLDALDAT